MGDLTDQYTIVYNNKHNYTEGASWGGIMKKYFKDNLILLFVLVFMSAALVLSGRTEAGNLKDFKIVSVFTHMNGNFGEPGHDPFWKSRGRRNNSDNRYGNTVILNELYGNMLR